MNFDEEKKRAVIYGKLFRNSVQMIIERGQTKGDDGKYHDDDSKEGRVTFFLDAVNSYNKKDGGKGYIVNIPISMLDELCKEMNTNEAFREFFGRLCSNGKIWELKAMVKRGASESTIRCYAKDLGLSDEMVNQVLSEGE
jgi:hypothetical protein